MKGVDPFTVAMKLAAACHLRIENPDMTLQESLDAVDHLDDNVMGIYPPQAAIDIIMERFMEVVHGSKS